MNTLFPNNHPMGPLTLADLIGLDVLLAVMQTIHGKHPAEAAD